MKPDLQLGSWCLKESKTGTTEECDAFHVQTAAASVAVPVSLGDLRRWVMYCLSSFDSPALEADLLICGLLGCERAWLHCHVPDAAPLYLLESLRRAVERRLQHEPLQYILGKCDFCGLQLKIVPGCLIPRPETELLVQAALDVFRGGTFLDWGTGSGCISLAILRERPGACALMIEKNPRSIECAWKNLKSCGLFHRALLIHSRSPEDIMPCRLSLLVSNPPYIPSAEVPKLMSEVSHYEPFLALDGGADGLRPYAALFALAQRSLIPGGHLCVEFGGAEQVQALRGMVPPDFVEEQMLLDINGHPRVFVWSFQ